MRFYLLASFACLVISCTGASDGGESTGTGPEDSGPAASDAHVPDSGSPTADLDAGSHDDGRVKVFVLSGQSNMVGHGTVEPSQQHLDRNQGLGTLRHLVTDDDTAARFARYTSGTTWASRADVWLVDLDGSGPLTVTDNTIGPELGFGHVLGDFYESPVVLIKASWGGRSLHTDFRPPSAGGETGEYYTALVARVHEVLGDLSAVYPSYAGTGYDLVGIAWHQGWNDRISVEHNPQYQQNCVHFINDLRAEFGSAELPFVLGITGMGGWDETHPRALSLMEGQLAVPTDPGLSSGVGVAAVETRDFWRSADDSPADQNYHWNRNAESYVLIGESLAEAMLALTDG